MRHGACSKRSPSRRGSETTPDEANSSRRLRVAVDGRALGAGATGVGRYIDAILATLHDDPAVDVRLYGRQAPAIIGPQLLAPLRMRGDRADCIHGPANALPLVRYGLPGVVTVHDLAIYDHPEWFPGGQAFATRVIVPQSIRRATAIISPSTATRAAVIRHFGVAASRCHVIPHGVEAAFAQPVPKAARDDVRRRYGLPDRYLMQVGTIQPRKNYEATLRALARIPVSGRLPLVAVGTFGWHYDGVLATVRQYQLGDWVRFVGYAGLHDLPALYQMATAVAFPSLDEGFGIPVLEAFAAGTPLAASNAGAIPEVAGQAALLSPPDDDEALAANLRAIVEDGELRGRLVEAGRARAAAYTWAASAAAHRQVYASVVGR